MSVPITNERYTLLRRISALGLAVHDTRLYLDIHDCPEAREYMKERYAEYKDAVEQYENIDGPINPVGHSCEDVRWAWQVD